MPNAPLKSITRTRYMELIASLGLDPQTVFSMRFDVDGIFAVVKAQQGVGKPLPMEMNEVAKNAVYIRVVDK